VIPLLLAISLTIFLGNSHPGYLPASDSIHFQAQSASLMFAPTQLLLVLASALNLDFYTTLNPNGQFHNDLPHLPFNLKAPTISSHHIIPFHLEMIIYAPSTHLRFPLLLPLIFDALLIYFALPTSLQVKYFLQYYSPHFRLSFHFHFSLAFLSLTLFFRL
jgi:hypothetical protein